MSGANKVADGFTYVKDGVIDAFSSDPKTPVEEVQDGASQIGAGIKNANDAVGDSIKRGADKTGETFTNVKDGIKDAFSSAPTVEIKSN